VQVELLVPGVQYREHGYGAADVARIGLVWALFGKKWIASPKQKRLPDSLRRLPDHHQWRLGDLAGRGRADPAQPGARPDEYDRRLTTPSCPTLPRAVRHTTGRRRRIPAARAVPRAVASQQPAAAAWLVPPLLHSPVTSIRRCATHYGTATGRSGQRVIRAMQHISGHSGGPSGAPYFPASIKGMLALPLPKREQAAALQARTDDYEMPMEPASVSPDLISQLAAMPLAERLLLIANDVGSRTDKFAAVPCRELAELLGVPGAEQP